MKGVKMFLDSNDLNEAEKMYELSNNNETYEFETVFHPVYTQWTREDFVRLMNSCREKCCSGNNVKCIKEREKTLDISVGEFRVSILGKYYIELYIQNKEDLNTLPSQSYSIVKKSKIQNHFTKHQSIKLNLKDETKVDIDDASFSSVLLEWTTLGKTFRMKNRYSYLFNDYYSLDMTVVKSAKNGHQLIRSRTLMNSRTLDADETYEVELEYVSQYNSDLTSKFDKDLWYSLVNFSLSHLNHTLKVVNSETLMEVKKKYAKVLDADYDEKQLHQPVSWHLKRYGLGPQVVSMDMPRFRKIKDMRDEEYTITMKSDGLRMFGFITSTEGNDNCELYLSGSKFENFIPTGVIFDKVVDGTVFDGEFVDKDKNGVTIADYIIFDCYYYNGKDIRRQSLMNGSESRLYVAQKVMSEMKLKESLLDGIQYNIFVKEFDLLTKSNFHKKCTAWLQKVEESPYENDGLIFTPNEAVGGEDLYMNKSKKGIFVKSSGTFERLLKWKDISMNSIDFKVEEENQINNKMMVIDGKSVLMPFKSCILKVVYSDTWKPTVEFTREDYLNSKEVFSYNKNKNNVLEFMPYTPPDPQACFVEFPVIGNTMRCKTSTGWDGDSFKNGDIVEMVFSEGDVKWIPIRVRKDKMTPNHFDVASNIWKIYFNPVSQEILKGEKEIPDIEDEEDAYYNQVSVTNRNLARKESGLRIFHCYVKGLLLENAFNNLPSNQRILLDLACGKGGDLKRYLDYGASGVIGIDNSVDNLHNPIDGAYRRLWKLNVDNKNKIIFMAGDVSKSLQERSTFIKPYDRMSETEIFMNKPYFDVASVFFAFHYFCKDEATLSTFLDNVSHTVKRGGYFIGCCYDGSVVFNKLKDKDSVSFKSNNMEMLRIEKKYNDHNDELLPSDKSSLGKTIRVMVQSIGTEHEEYLVNFEYIKKEMAKRGFIEISTKSFEAYYLENTRFKYTMSYEEQEASFLNRTFIFKRDDNQLMKKAVLKKLKT
tara:strand:+ start:6590 stop:9553 length:2964 start_codon:yes stop_codon:yes gene_type:complete